MDITHRCNMKCANCYIPNRKIPDMDTDKLIKFIKRLPFKTFIRIIGAEPTMREDLPEIVYQIKKSGHHPSLTTNGLKLADYDYVKALWKSGLKMFLISMNGADDNDTYKAIDNACCAELKCKALSNLFKVGALINIGCIIARGVNEHIPMRLVRLVVNTAEKNGYKFNHPWKSPCIRFKNIGAIGRHMQNKDCSFADLIRIVSSNLHIDQKNFWSNPCISGSNLTLPTHSAVSRGWFADEESASYMTTLKTSPGDLHIRIIDWTVNKNGVPNAGNRNRGRVTKDWKIAPFFEDKKLNEYGY